MRVIVTGSRTWREPVRVYDALDLCADAGNMVLVHGACRRGVDHYAHQWYEHSGYHNGFRVVEDPFPADWNKYGKRAGFIRNQEMVDTGADLVLAFANWCEEITCPRHDIEGDHMSHGTENCVLAAEKANLEVVTFWSRI